MAGITLAKAIDSFSRELGCGDENDRNVLIDAIIRGIEHLMFNGGGDILREWKITVRNGRFTFPRDLETPIKYKFSRLANAGFGSFHSPYVSYASTGIKTCCGYHDWDPQFAVSANKVATEFTPPKCGLRLLATTRDERDVGKRIQVGGRLRGKDVAPWHNKVKTSGELLTIYGENDTQKKYGAWTFDEITHVIKDLTCSYVMLSGIDNLNNFSFLSHYHPDEEVPQYTEGELFACPPHSIHLFNNQHNRHGRSSFQDCEFIINILGRTNPSIRYIRDEDILPISSSEMLNLLAKRARYDDNGDFDDVAVMEQRIRILIRKTVAYQQAPVRQLSFNMKASGASLVNI